MASSFKLKQVKQDNHAFMSCILKVHTEASGWQKTVVQVLNNIHGIYNFRMDEAGRVEVSGKVTPTLLLKMLGKAGKKAEIVWWQFGECSSNLFVPVAYSDYMNYGGYGNHGYNSGYGHGSSTYFGGGGGYYGGDAYGGIGSYGGDRSSLPYGYGERPHLQPWDRPSISYTCPTRSYVAGERGTYSRRVNGARTLALDSEGGPNCCTMM